MSQLSKKSQTEIFYHSSDLELFAHATNWKSYWSARLRPYIQGIIIEVGAGLGNSTAYMCTGNYSRWLCLDPDTVHVHHLESRIASGTLPKCCQARRGILADLPSDELVDTIIYIDVLEHIKDDEGEMRLAAAHLRSGGKIIVLSPAFNWLYSPFDKAVGHFRRYNKNDARRLTVRTLSLSRIFYLDSIGLLASVANRLILRTGEPSLSQIKFWDDAMIPISRYADRLFGSLFGRSIVMVWHRSE